MMGPVSSFLFPQILAAAAFVLGFFPVRYRQRGTPTRILILPPDRQATRRNVSGVMRFRTWILDSSGQESPGLLLNTVLLALVNHLVHPVIRSGIPR